jgi:hypothetical protein
MMNPVAEQAENDGCQQIAGYKRAKKKLFGQWLRILYDG